MSGEQTITRLDQIVSNLKIARSDVDGDDRADIRHRFDHRSDTLIVKFFTSVNDLFYGETWMGHAGYSAANSYPQYTVDIVFANRDLSS